MEPETIKEQTLEEPEPTPSVAPSLQPSVQKSTCSLVSLVSAFQSDANEWEAINKFKLWEDYQHRKQKHQQALATRKQLADDLLKQHN